MTTRKLGLRIAEHKRIDSPIGQHLIICKDCCSSDLADRFGIIDKGRDYDSLTKLEAIYIATKKPILNTAMTDNTGYKLKLNF